MILPECEVCGKKKRGRPTLGNGPTRRMQVKMPVEVYNRIPAPKPQFVRDAIEEKLNK